MGSLPEVRAEHQMVQQGLTRCVRSQRWPKAAPQRRAGVALLTAAASMASKLGRLAIGSARCGQTPDTKVANLGPQRCLQHPTDEHHILSPHHIHAARPTIDALAERSEQTEEH